MNLANDNLRVAERLAEAARLLKARGSSIYSVRAYRRAGDSVARTPRDVRRLYRSLGLMGLDALPNVGLGIASAIGEMLETGHWTLLDRLRAEADPETLRKLATRAARARRAAPAPRPGEPPVAILLAIDAEYRAKAAAGSLPLIAPRKFNPAGERWLPVLHATRDGWLFTALFSNTALAHQTGQTHDWVVIYYHDGDAAERRCTVVTEYHGPHAGLRTVRGREAECGRHHEEAAHELDADPAP